jgi:predicted dehydrogenase
MARRKLRYGMVGGGPGAFIGAVHRRAAAFDSLAEIAAGAFSSSAATSRAFGAELGLDPERAYGSFMEMAEREAALPADERIDFVSIVTPNFTHFTIARAFLERGFHVICDKPLTVSLDEAEALCRMAADRGLVFAVTYTYAGYPMIKQARAMVRDGALGDVRKIVVEYTQGWLAAPIEREGQRQASWRTDPAKAGAGAIGDIGTHAEHLARYVSGLALESLCADVTTMVEGRPIDDDASMLLRFKGGARGVLTASQALAGEENGLAIRVFGSQASLEWRHVDPNTLVVRRPDRPAELYTRGNAYLAPEAQRAARLPSGHAEGYAEAFANTYANVLRTIAARVAGEEPDPADLDFPTVQDGAIGVHFIHAALTSGREGRWVNAAYDPPGAGAGTPGASVTR